jgi:Metallo-peptidase family M12/Secretion system C-terminal sorting domain
MKKIFLLITILSFSAYSQNEVGKKVAQLLTENTTFRHFSVLTQSNEISNKETKSVVDKATFAKINVATVNLIVANRYENLEIEIPYQSETVVVQLYKVNLFAEGFHIDTDKAKNIAYNPGVYYRGIVKNDTKSVVSFNFFENELNAIISSDSLNNLVIGKLDKINNNSDYIIYSDSDMKVNNNYKCATKESETSVSTSVSNRNVLSTRCVTMYFEIDNNIYQSNGNSTTTTTNWMTSVFNNVQTLYNNDGITVSLKSTFIWTTLDPYNGIGTSSSDYLFKFNEVRPIFDGDVGQLVGIDAGGLGGVAVSINGLCTQDNFSYSDVNFAYSTVPTYSWTVQVITHEFGHLLGSPHTHACVWNGNNTAIDNCAPQALGTGWEGGSCMTSPPTIPSGTMKGTIMSYCHLINGVGIKFSNGFGNQPKNKILTAVNSGLCLSTNCISTCINTVSSINVTNSTSTSVSFSWVDAGSTSWQVAVIPFNGTTPVWNNATTNNYTATGLTPNTYYRIRVRKSCSAGLIASDRQTVLLTPDTYCSGITLTDTGGTAANYTDSETYVRTLIPNIANKRISLTFTDFSLELDYDYMHVYDGNSVTATEFDGPLGYTGTTIPGPFTSTAADGSLTIKFYSDGGVVDAGYVANVTCLNSLGNSDFNQIDFSYYPNPTNGIVKINSNTEITEIKVYSVTGQLLFEDKTKQLNSNVNIVDFANGTYFFKVNFGEKETNFKINKK